MKSCRFAFASIAFASAGSLSALAQSATQDINITATVPKYCAIGGGASPAALNTTIPVSSTGTVTTTVQTFTVNSVVCNVATNVVASSVSGGVKSSAVASSGFTNIIDYTGAATFGTATSTINTATTPTATGSESGNTATTTGATSGNLTISVTPSQPSSALVAATDYSDILRITLTPQ